MKILFLTKYTDKGASSRYRSYNYRKWLEKEGIIPCFEPLLDNTYVEGLYERNKIKKFTSIMKRTSH